MPETQKPPPSWTRPPTGRWSISLLERIKVLSLLLFQELAGLGTRKPPLPLDLKSPPRDLSGAKLLEKPQWPDSQR